MARKSRNWAHLIRSSAAVTGGGNAITDLLAAYKTEVGINDVRGKTIGTIFGELVFVDGAAVGNNSNTQSRVAFGIGVVNTGLGASSAPVPGDDSFGWMWYLGYHYTQLATYVAGLDGSEVFRNVEHRIPIHIRAMRKLDMNDQLVLKVHVFSGADVNVAFDGNCLLLG